MINELIYTSKLLRAISLNKIYEQLAAQINLVRESISFADLKRTLRNFSVSSCMFHHNPDRFELNQDEYILYESIFLDSWIKLQFFK